MDERKEWILTVLGRQATASISDASPKQLQMHVGGKTKTVRIPSMPDYLMVANENGMPEGLPVNWGATMLSELYLGDSICGPAVIVRVEGEEILPLTWQEAKRVTGEIGKLVAHANRYGKRGARNGRI